MVIYFQCCSDGVVEGSEHLVLFVWELYLSKCLSTFTMEPLSTLLRQSKQMTFMRPGAGRQLLSFSFWKPLTSPEQCYWIDPGQTRPCPNNIISLSTVRRNVKPTPGTYDLWTTKQSVSDRRKCIQFMLALMCFLWQWIHQPCIGQTANFQRL